MDVMLTMPMQQFLPCSHFVISGILMGIFAGSALNSYPNLKSALEANNPDKVWDEVLKLALAKIESSPYAGTDIANVVKRYINADRINQGQTYYLMSGGLKKITVANKAYDPTIQQVHLIMSMMVHFQSSTS